jgi:hypothetical protein
MVALPVLGAPVPETPVDEDSHASRPEDDVGLAAQRRQGRSVQPVPQPEGVERPP